MTQLSGAQRALSVAGAVFSSRHTDALVHTSGGIAMEQMERGLRLLVLKQLITWTTLKREFFLEGASPKLGK